MEVTIGWLMLLSLNIWCTMWKDRFEAQSLKTLQEWTTLDRTRRQFCTTPPVGILLGLRSKSLGWIPTVSVPNPDQPPLVIFLTHPYFCTKRKRTCNSNFIPTKSHQLFSFSFPFHLWKLGFWWDEWLVTSVEKWKLVTTSKISITKTKLKVCWDFVGMTIRVAE